MIIGVILGSLIMILGHYMPAAPAVWWFGLGWFSITAFAAVLEEIS